MKMGAVWLDCRVAQELFSPLPRRVVQGSNWVSARRLFVSFVGRTAAPATRRAGASGHEYAADSCVKACSAHPASE